jgi:hypothetical protein
MFTLNKPLAIISVLTGIVIGVNGYSVYDMIWDDPQVARAARDATIVEEQKKAAQLRQEQQKIIDEADRKLEEYRIANRLRSEVIRTAIERQKEDDAKVQLDRSKCVLPERVRIAIQ